MPIDVAESQAIFGANRAKGAVRVDAALIDGRTRRRLVDESGSLRVRFPGGATKSWLQAVLVNTAGGIAGGDEHRLDMRADSGARLLVTTSAAEKIYRSHGPDSTLSLRLEVASGAALHWLPQETIMFDQARMRRTVEAHLAEDATLILCEIAVFGRTAMGETMRTGLFADQWRIYRSGRLVFADNIRLDGDIAEVTARRGSLAGGVCIGTLLMAPGSEDIIIALRALAPHADVEMAASHWRGVTLMRFCSRNSAALRTQVTAALACCAGGAPRPWLQ